MALSVPDDLFLRLQAALAGEYSIERELGRGGMGVVYLAREVRLAREVAIKVLPPSLADVPTLRAQFLREAQIAARLSHPHIVPIHRVDESQGFVYFVMTYIAGETLAERIRRRGPMTPSHAARMLREVAWALTYAHSAGIVHRDVKADNILLEYGTERALVTDFGIAGAARVSARTNAGQIAGTPHYASPEQIAGQPVDAASDLYSLGVVGFLTLTGRLPFDAPTAQEVVAMHLDRRPPSVDSIATAVPAALARIVDRCLAKKPAHRYPSAAAFADAVEQAVEAPRELPAPIRVWLAGRRQGGVIAVLGAYAAVAVAGPLVMMTHSAVTGIGAALAAFATVAAAPAFFRTRRVLRDGYDITDLRAALREHWARRREEMAYEWSAEARKSGSPLGSVFWGSVAATVASTLAVSATSTPAYAMMVPMFLTAGLSVVTGVMLAGRAFRRRQGSTAGSQQIAFYEGMWGQRWVRIAGFGVKRRLGAHVLPQFTEIALGRATDALFNALHKPVRKQLRELPAVVRRLENDATRLRGEIEKLDASIVSLDDDARTIGRSAVHAPSHGEDRVSTEQDRLRSDLRSTRQSASDRLAATVAALENIRINLLRLQLGDGRIEAVTESLDVAHRVAADIADYADAVIEVEQALAPTTTGGTPLPVT